MRHIRAEDDAKRLAKFEKEMDPSLRERLENFVVGSRRGEPEYAPPEPGPDYEPHRTRPASGGQKRRRSRNTSATNRTTD